MLCVNQNKITGKQKKKEHDWSLKCRLLILHVLCLMLILTITNSKEFNLKKRETEMEWKINETLENKIAQF